jgi:hypothetical protein
LIDGVKMKVLNLNSNIWHGCQTLEFAVSVSSRTGEVFTNKPQLAERNGLTFKIVPPVNPSDAETCYVLGSLHKFKNHGLHNANDFTLTDIRQVVLDLAELHVKPLSTILENIEFGVNIELPYTCSDVLNAMISMSNRQFVELKFSGVPNGKRLSRSRFEFKIYDKGKLQTGQSSNLLRVELRVKEMRFLNKTVVNLNDLTDKNRLLALGKILINQLQKVVMYGHALTEIDKKTPHLQIKLYQWTNANWWSSLNNSDRYREQKAFNEYTQSTGAAAMKAVLIDAISKKWLQLLESDPSVLQQNETVLRTNLPTFETVLNETVSINETVFATFAPTFETVSNETVSGKRNGFGDVCAIKINAAFIKQQQTTKQNNEEKGVFLGAARNFENLRICECCGLDISTKRPQSVFCSISCKNRFNNSRRSKRDPSVSGAVEPSPMVTAAKVGRSKRDPSVSGAVEPSPVVTAAKVERSKIDPSVSGAVSEYPKQIDYMLEWGEGSNAEFDKKRLEWNRTKRNV